jgi:hypothetical protein
MSLWNIFDWIVFALIAVCIAVWPTQLISDGLNRWLRIAAVVLVALQVLVGGPRLPWVPVYLIALLFALLLIADRRVDHEPSSVRESHEGTLKKAIRWTLVLGCAAALLASVVLSLLYARPVA